jgi:PEP-CTERM motif
MNIARPLLGLSLTLAASLAQASVSLALPGASLTPHTPLTSAPELYAGVLASWWPTTFTHEFTFDLATLSGVAGSVTPTWGSVTFSSVKIDGEALALIPFNTAYKFSDLNLAPGVHTLTVSGSVLGGLHAYHGSLATVLPAVPEPESLAMLLAGLGLMAFRAARTASPRMRKL